MKVSKKKTLCVLLSMALAVSAICFSNKPIETNTVEASNNILVRSAPSTVKINRDKHYTDDELGGMKIQLSMCRNEKEGAQIILTPTGDVASYDVKISALNYGSDSIPIENIAVFNQHYIETATKSNDYSELGWYPDALIPFENAKQAGENNVKAGNNQGIWFRFETTEDTAAGVYTGTFELTVDGNVFNIPVEVNVWDFAIPEYEWPKTMFNLWLTYLTQGEYDQSLDMWEKYFDFFLDYGITSNGLMIEGTNTSSFLTYLEKYYDKLSSYNLPSTYDYSSNDGRLHFGFSYEWMEKLVKDIVKLSHDKGKDYLKKAYIYNFYVDEYHATWAFGDTRIKDAQYFMSEIVKVWDRVAEYFDLVYGKNYIDSVEGLRDSLNNIGILSVNATWIDGTTDLFNVWCPNTIGVINQKNFMDRLDDSGNNLKEIWWYTTIGCDYPISPGYQIDDPLVDERIMSWMQYDFGISGNMMWASNLYSSNVEYGLSPGDEWTEANRCTGGKWNGDGFQVYPGYNYGIDGPIGTIRLENIRDGMEEYKYLKVLENLYGELSEYYGMQLDNRDALQPIFDSLHTHIAPNYDVDNFNTQREAVANHILRAQGDEKIAFYNYNETINYFDVSVVIDKDYTISSDNLIGTPVNTVNGKGKIYSFRVSKEGLGDISLVFTYTNGVNFGAFSEVLAEGGQTLIAFDTVSDKDYISVSGATGTEFGMVETVDGVIGQGITLKTYVGFESYTKYPYIKIDTDTLKELADNVKCYYLDIYNDSDTDIQLEVYCISAKQDNIINVVNLTSKSWTRIKLIDVETVLRSDELRFAFANGSGATETDAVSQEYRLYISRFAYSAK